jgi:RNA polymerase sigma-70 factor (ECF subfamily)
VEHLPEQERQLVELLWYQGLEQQEVAKVLDVCERTVRRRWRSAKLRLYELLDGRVPPF